MKRSGLTPHLVSATLFLVSGFASSVRAQETMTPPAAKSATPTMGAPKRETKDELMKRVDKNGDGRIDDDERAEARELMLKEQIDRQMMRATALPGGPQAFLALALELFDKNGDGQLDEEERSAARSFAEQHGFGAGGELREELMKRFDKNANGRIDDDERVELGQYLKERMAQTPGTQSREAVDRKELENIVRSAIQANAAQRQRFDHDKDGILSDQEWAAARRIVLSALGDTTTSSSAGPSPEQEKRRLQAVAAEVLRRRQIREKAHELKGMPGK